MSQKQNQSRSKEITWHLFNWHQHLSKRIDLTAEQPSSTPLLRNDSELDLRIPILILKQKDLFILLFFILFHRPHHNNPDLNTFLNKMRNLLDVVRCVNVYFWEFTEEIIDFQSAELCGGIRLHEGYFGERSQVLNDVFLLFYFLYWFLCFRLCFRFFLYFGKVVFRLLLLNRNFG